MDKSTFRFNDDYDAYEITIDSEGVVVYGNDDFGDKMTNEVVREVHQKLSEYLEMLDETT